MKLSCDVIQDLLPLYHDGVCSKESKRIVEEHIATCAACKDVLHGLKEELAPDSVDAAEPLSAIGKAWKKSRKTALLKGAVIVTAVFLLLLGSYWGLTQWHRIPIESKNLRVGEVTQVDEGVIHCELGIWDDNDAFGYFKYTLTEDGKLFMTPMRSVITRADRWSDVGFYRDFNNLFGLRGIEYGSRATGFYFGTPEDHLVIWEEGMELPAANEQNKKEWSDYAQKRSEFLEEWFREQKKLEDLENQYQATVAKGIK